jgi:hypothetical protein
MSFNYGIYKGKTYLAKAKGNADAVAIAIALGRGTSIKYCDRIAWKYPDVLEKLSPIDVYTQVNVLNAKINQNYLDVKDKTEARRVDCEKKKDFISFAALLEKEQKGE